MLRHGEIARQLRLRDLGGLIVIDFIDMLDKKHIAEIEKVFKKALSMDRARIQLSRISKFGILELSRQKKQSTIQEISYITCPYCKGTGLRPSLEYASLVAFRKIESEAVKGIYTDLKVSLPNEIAHILNNKRAEIMKLESTCGVGLLIEEGRIWHGTTLRSALIEGRASAGQRHAGVPLLKLAAQTEADADSETKTEKSPTSDEPKKKRIAAFSLRRRKKPRKRRRP